MQYLGTLGLLFVAAASAAAVIFRRLQPAPVIFRRLQPAPERIRTADQAPGDFPREP